MIGSSQQGIGRRDRAGGTMCCIRRNVAGRGSGCRRTGRRSSRCRRARNSRDGLGVVVAFDEDPVVEHRAGARNADHIPHAPTRTITTGVLSASPAACSLGAVSCQLPVDSRYPSAIATSSLVPSARTPTITRQHSRSSARSGNGDKWRPPIEPAKGFTPRAVTRDPRVDRSSRANRPRSLSRSSVRSPGARSAKSLS